MPPLREVTLTGIDIEDVMEFADDIPSDFHRWVFGERIRPAFLVRKTENEKNFVTGKCFACGTVNRIPRAAASKHRGIFQCPFCGTEVECLHAARYETGKPGRGERVSFVERLDDAGTMFMFRYLYAYEDIDLNKDAVCGSGILELGRDLVTFHEGNVQYRRFEHSPDGWKPSVDNGERIRWSPLQTVSGLERYGYGSHIYPKSIDDAFEGQMWANCRISACAEDPAGSRYYLFEEVPEAFYRYPVTAELVRNGLSFLVAALGFRELEEVNNRRNQGEPLYKAIGLRNVRDLGNISMCHTAAAYRLYADFLSEGIAVTGNDLSWIEAIFLKEKDRYGTESVKRILTGHTKNVHGLIRYMLGETKLRKKPGDNTAQGFLKARRFLFAWSDYQRNHTGEEIFPENLRTLMKAGERKNIPA